MSLLERVAMDFAKADEMGYEAAYPVPEPAVAPTREQINRLQGAMAKLPQAELVTEHYFANGMYCRKLFRPATTIIVGKVHKHEHLFMVLQGEIEVRSEHGVSRMKAGDVIVSKPGTKRVTLAITDAIGLTVHRTDNTDLDAIEAEIIEAEDGALFDARNNLKPPGLEDKK